MVELENLYDSFTKKMTGGTGEHRTVDLLLEASELVDMYRKALKDEEEKSYVYVGEDDFPRSMSRMSVEKKDDDDYPGFKLLVDRETKGYFEYDDDNEIIKFVLFPTQDERDEAVIVPLETYEFYQDGFISAHNTLDGMFEMLIEMAENEYMSEEEARCLENYYANGGKEERIKLIENFNVQVISK